MSLDVPAPDPPELRPALDPEEYDDVDVQGDEYRREELQEYLEEGTWDRAFDEWAEYSDLGEREWRIVIGLELIGRFDFFWDFNVTTRRLSHSKSGKSSGASYSVSHSMYSFFNTSHTICPSSVSPALIPDTVPQERRLS